jgi:hypothetical protein
MNNDNNSWRSTPYDDTPSGHARFDDRGNAVWESWSAKALDNPDLALDEAVNQPRANAPLNVFGVKRGYNPYDSGFIGKSQKPRKKDLRALSDWIQREKQRRP